VQYLYILASSPDDNYYEQFLLSTTSLRLKMPNAQITLLCDGNTKQNLVGKRSGYEKIVSNIIVSDTPAHTSQLEISRWLKTSMRRLVTGDFLFIDCDTIIADDLSSDDLQGVKLAACLDRHSLISAHSKSDFIVKNDKHLGFSSYISNKHYNSGVIFFSDTPESYEICERWHELWLFSKNRNIFRDQPAFNMAISEKPSFITELDGTWNCQIAYNSLPYLAKSKVIHYYASDSFLNAPIFILSSDEIAQKIKNTGIITDDILNFLEDPKTAFVPESRIVTGLDALHVINSDFFQLLLLMRKKIPLFFKFINFICSFFKKITKHILYASKKKKGKTIYN